MIPPLLDIARLRAAYADGSCAPAELAATLFDRIAAHADQAVFIARRPRADVIAEARGADPALPLAGLIFAVKDNIDVAGLPTTAACPAFAYLPARDATVVARLRAAGAIPIGKTNLDQFATGLNGTRSPYGAPRCVFDRRYIAGGSSSGSAVAVAAGLSVFALGTDTAGSGRVPAAFNNIIGLKPTRGRIAATGVVPACQSLDCVSIFANSCADAQSILAVAEGVDPADPYSRPPGLTHLPAAPRIGVLGKPERWFDGDADCARLYNEALDHASGLGWQPVEIDYAPFREAAALLYDDAFVAERLAAIRPFFDRHPDSVDPTVRAIVEGGRRFDAADLFAAQTKLMALRRLTDQQLALIDALLLPTAPTIFTVAALRESPVARNATLGRYTNFVNLLDLAAVALPAGFRADGLPFGLSLIGPAFSDRALLALADRLHENLSPGIGQACLAPATRLPSNREDRLSLMVVGAHLAGMPLNHQLTDLGARFEEATLSAPDYRLFALTTEPSKPALVSAPGFNGPGIAVERWSLTPEAFGRFVALVPAPMTIGKLRLADGRIFPGFLCEPAALTDATDITAHGGWCTFLATNFR